MKPRVLNHLVVLVAALVFILSAFPAHAQTYTVLYNFGTVKCDPLDPTVSGIIAQGRDGNLYSSTGAGGCDLAGAAFKITPKGKLTVLHSFGSQSGDQGVPVGGVTLGTDGDFWGTSEGGDFGGIIWKMTGSGKLTNFSGLGGTNNSNGIEPTAPPVQGMDGNFYGSASQGGNIKICTYSYGGCGVIYRISPSGKGFKVIHTFDQFNGANPDSPVTLGTDGNFYGTTVLGGSIGKTFINDGVVFRVTPSGKYTVLHVFCSLTACADGENPYDGLVQASDGNFYGTTYFGGKGLLPYGVVFKITPGGKLTVLYNFCSLAACADGSNPYGGLVQGTDGNFYGATVYGGTHTYGTLYQITPQGKHTVLYNFDSTTGAYPETTLALNTNGILYGDTYEGGSGVNGVFFSLSMNLKPSVSMVNWYGEVAQTVEILGQGLKGTTAVSFNGTAATTFTVVSDTYLTAVVPSGTTPGFVTVTTPGGRLTSNRQFRVLPFIKSFSPPNGAVGTPVTINGTSFTGTTKVTFGGVKATVFTVVSDIEITANVPSGAKTGKIQVTTPTGTATSATDFTVTQ